MKLILIFTAFLYTLVWVDQAQANDFGYIPNAQGGQIMFTDEPSSVPCPWAHNYRVYARLPTGETLEGCLTMHEGSGFVEVAYQGTATRFTYPLSAIIPLKSSKP